MKYIEFLFRTREMPEGGKRQRGQVVQTKNRHKEQGAMCRSFHFPHSR